MYTVIYRRFTKRNVVSHLRHRRFGKLESACEFGGREFARPDNFDTYLQLPSGRMMAFTKMYGLV